MNETGEVYGGAPGLDRGSDEGDRERCVFPSPLGLVTLEVDAGGSLVRLGFGSDGVAGDGGGAGRFRGPGTSGVSPAMREVMLQLEAYFAGELRDFSFAVAPGGTPFQRRVWQELQRIPFGITRSYSEIAARVGNPRATRAVGAASSRNPIAIVIPCHRVVGADGSLTGYAAGVEVKAALLSFEEGVVQPGLPFWGDSRI